MEVAKGGKGEEDSSYTSVHNAFPGIVTAIKVGVEATARVK